MDEIKDQKDQSVYPQSAGAMLYAYQMMESNEMDLTELLGNLLILTNSSVSTALMDARNVTQARGRGRGTYGGVSKALMDFQLPKDALDVNQEVEELSIEFITSAINSYFDKYREMPDINTREGQSAYNRVMVLMIQLYTSNGRNLLPDLRVPKYAEEKMKIVDDFLEKEGESVFLEWLDKMADLGNENLIPYVDAIGTDFFGWNTKSDPDTTWSKYMHGYASDIKNPGEMYQMYKVYREKFKNCTTSLQQVNLYNFFGLTADKLNKVQKKLYNEFKENYMNDMNSQYLKKLINGTED